MSIRQYFKPQDRLPHPKGSLSASIPWQAIALANREVERVVLETAADSASGKRGLYKRWESIDCSLCWKLCAATVCNQEITLLKYRQYYLERKGWPKSKSHTYTSVDHKGRQSAIRRARTLSDRSLLLCVDIVTEQKKLRARRRLGTWLDTALSWPARLQ